MFSNESDRHYRPPWHALYKKQRWRNRAKLQLTFFPTCSLCDEEGVVNAATIADHIDPPRGNETKFWFGELRSVCKFHHDSVRQFEDKNGFRPNIGVDGFPSDPRHPFNKAKGRS